MSKAMKTYCSVLHIDEKKNWDCWHKEIKRNDSMLSNTLIWYRFMSFSFLEQNIML